MFVFRVLKYFFWLFIEGEQLWVPPCRGHDRKWGK